MNKTKQIHLYLNDTDYNTIKRAAEARETTANDFIRYCVRFVIDNTYIRDYKND